MTIGRKLAGFLLAVSAWNVVTYVTFIRNLAGTEDRPTGYYVAHAVLIAVNLAIAAVLLVVGLRAWRAASARRGDTDAPGPRTSDPEGLGQDTR